MSLHDPKTDAKQHNLDLNISIRIFDTEICRYYWAFAKSPALLLCKLLIRQWDWIGLGILPNQFSKLSTFWTSKLHCWKIEHQRNQVPFQHSLFFAFLDKTLHGPMRDGTKMWCGSSCFPCTFLHFVGKCKLKEMAHLRTVCLENVKSSAFEISSNFHGCRWRLTKFQLDIWHIWIFGLVLVMSWHSIQVNNCQKVSFVLTLCFIICI